VHDTAAGRLTEAAQRSRIDTQKFGIARNGVRWIPPIAYVMHRRRPRVGSTGADAYFVHKRKTVCTRVSDLGRCNAADRPKNDDGGQT
jgi:hypothetical protein